MSAATTTTGDGCTFWKMILQVKKISTTRLFYEFIKMYLHLYLNSWKKCCAYTEKMLVTNFVAGVTRNFCGSLPPSITENFTDQQNLSKHWNIVRRYIRESLICDRNLHKKPSPCTSIIDPNSFEAVNRTFRNKCFLWWSRFANGDYASEYFESAKPETYLAMARYGQKSANVQRDGKTDSEIM